MKKRWKILAAVVATFVSFFLWYKIYELTGLVRTLIFMLGQAALIASLIYREERDRRGR